MLAAEPAMRHRFILFVIFGSLILTGVIWEVRRHQDPKIIGPEEMAQAYEGPQRDFAKVYEEIKDGMSEDEVVSLLGPAGDHSLAPWGNHGRLKVQIMCVEGFRGKKSSDWHFPDPKGIFSIRVGFDEHGKVIDKKSFLNIE